MKPRQLLGKYFEVYGQGDQITPEAGKKGSFFDGLFVSVNFYSTKNCWILLKLSGNKKIAVILSRIEQFFIK